MACRKFLLMIKVDIDESYQTTYLLLLYQADIWRNAERASPLARSTVICDLL